MLRETGPRPAAFLDRDGVLNRNVFYHDTAAWESPRRPADFVPADGIVPALASLQEAGFLLFLVSNQPNVAKGKSTPAELAAIHALLLDHLLSHKITLTRAYYCRHHPAFTGPCICRKPSPYFLLNAASTYHLALSKSWMVGDRGTDMECGRAAGARTAWVRTGQPSSPPGPQLVDVLSENLPDAARQILSRSRPTH